MTPQRYNINPAFAFDSCLLMSLVNCISTPIQLQHQPITTTIKLTNHRVKGMLLSLPTNTTYPLNTAATSLGLLRVSVIKHGKVIMTTQVTGEFLVLNSGFNSNTSQHLASDHVIDLAFVATSIRDLCDDCQLSITISSSSQSSLPINAVLHLFVTQAKCNNITTTIITTTMHESSIEFQGNAKFTIDGAIKYMMIVIKPIAATRYNYSSAVISTIRINNIDVTPFIKDTAFNHYQHSYSNSILGDSVPVYIESFCDDISSKAHAVDGFVNGVTVQVTTNTTQALEMKVFAVMYVSVKLVK